MHARRWWVGLTAACLVLAGTAGAQDDTLDVRVNYVYAAQFGFGAYELGGLRVNVYTLPIPYTWEDVYRDWDLHLRVPIVYGRYRFATHFEQDGVPVAVRANTNSIATAPRLQLDIPLLVEGLRISPLGSWGVGTTFDSGGHVRVGDQRIPVDDSESWFYTWQLGLSTLYQRHWRAWTGNLGSALIWAGDDAFDDSGDIESYGTWRVGVEARHPLGFTIVGRVPDAGAHVIYDRFFPSLEFSRARRRALEVTDLVEIGLTFGAASPLELPWLGDLLDDLQLGAAYQTGDGLDAWKLSTGFPF